MLLFTTWNRIPLINYKLSPVMEALLPEDMHSSSGARRLLLNQLTSAALLVFTVALSKLISIEETVTAGLFLMAPSSNSC